MIPLTVLCALLLGFTISEAGTIAYQEDTADIANPERGFYQQSEIWLNAGLASSWFTSNRTSQKITVFRVYCRIDSFRTKALPQAFLDSLTANFSRARAAGAKIIPRFAYNFGNGPDAAESQVLAHIDQLAPVLRANYDVIAFMEAGFIGYWGEWHSSTNNLDNTSSRRNILFRLLSALPSERMAALRYSGLKRAIFGSNTPLAPDSGFSGSYRARVGAHNDCLGASAGDWGTYPTDSIEWDKDYLNQDNRYLPQGGETCNPSAYSDCAHMVPDLIRMRWDVLNIGYHQDVLASWQSGGCFTDAKKKLGYRLRLITATLADSVRPGGTLTGSFRIVNDGYGKAYNPRGLELVLRAGVTKQKTFITLSADPRRWLAGDTATVPISVTIPSTLALGSYELLLNLPDTIGRIHNRSEYAIRLANKNLWEDSTGYNRLQATLFVNLGASAGTMLPTRTGRLTSVTSLQLFSIAGRRIGDSGSICLTDRAMRQRGLIVAVPRGRSPYLFITSR